ncbi:MAG: DUF2811 domain-containing protein [Flavobacteriaceae bacterium]|nr:DUF2811 domain-containing protein [Pelagibacteraceae bacterium]MBT6170143.1 DUF2811 domain-containing protein [Flavobacteriaceae bacterium]MBT6448723.1 DUF2811 domain-containing protein [Flavobacteriaceae bacterium]MBT7403389.1 DUF2811 domain-containing protein [Flavobacteriaceae bacterium]
MEKYIPCLNLDRLKILQSALSHFLLHNHQQELSGLRYPFVLALFQLSLQGPNA